MRQPRAALSTEGPQPRNPDDDDAAESGSLLPNASPDLDAEIFAISLPTLATLAADPLAALVSTAWVGQMGATELGGVGVALSVYNSFTKLFNMPLLAVVTSSTANALGRGHADDSPEVGAAVASALALALAIGLLQAALLGIGGMAGLGAWGAGGESPLHGSAAAYLTVRALSAPATVFFLALQGVFRGLGDTRAPFYATLVSNALNVVLEPIFIFVFGWGVRGAATAIAVAQVASCGVLIYLLQKRLSFKGMDAGALSGAWEHVRPTGLLIIRSLSVMGAFAVATGLAARTDAVHAAAHQIAFQLWLASSLLADSLAVAGQSLIARELAHGDARGRRYATDVVSRVTNLSLLLGMALATGLTVGCYILPLPRLFSSDMEVMSVLGLLLPAVIATQPLNALAFTLDGVLYGVNGFKYAAGAMIASALPAVAAMLLGMQAAGALGWTFDGRLLVVWGGLALLMFLRFATIMVPLRNLWPPFDKLRP